MDDKVKAAAKVAVGAAQVASGVATATGHGILGAICKKHHMMTQAVMLGRHNVQRGMEKMKEGMDDWKYS